MRSSIQFALFQAEAEENDSPSSWNFITEDGAIRDVVMAMGSLLVMQAAGWSKVMEVCCCYRCDVVELIEVDV